MSNIIELTDEEFVELQKLVEGFLYERGPTPTKVMKSLAVKIKLCDDLHSWMDRLLETE